MRLTLVVTATLLLVCPAIGQAQERGSSETAPRFLVGAEIADFRHGESLIAARLYYDEIEQSYHFDGQRNRLDLANREQELVVLQSQLTRFILQNSHFRTADGSELSVDQVKERISKDAAVLLLPKGASLHPAIKAVLKPDTIIVSRQRGTGPRKVIARPEP